MTWGHYGMFLRSLDVLLCKLTDSAILVQNGKCGHYAVMTNKVIHMPIYLFNKGINFIQQLPLVALN